MTITTNERGQMNMFAKEPSMYMTKEDLERYGIEPYAEKAEKIIIFMVNRIQKKPRKKLV
jgi:hypothetical protein